MKRLFQQLIVRTVLPVALLTTGNIMSAAETGTVKEVVNVATQTTDRVDITTKSGVTYSNCTIDRVEPNGITIFHSKGVVKIPFIDLPEELQSKYHYNSTNASAYTRAVNQRIAREQAQQAAVLKQINSKSNMVIKIGGLYLGMSMEKACEICNQSFPGITKPYVEQSPSGTYLHFNDEPIRVWGDNNKQINKIHLFQEYQVNRLFNVENMSVDEFRKQFIKNYNIPEKALNTVQYENEWWYEYVNSTDGYTLRFNPFKKEIMLQKTDRPAFK